MWVTLTNFFNGAGAPPTGLACLGSRQNMLAKVSRQAQRPCGNCSPLLIESRDPCTVANSSVDSPSPVFAPYVFLDGSWALWGPSRSLAVTSNCLEVLSSFLAVTGSY
jgi:hypothetical protein